MIRLLPVLVAAGILLAGCSSTPATGNDAACAEFAGFTDRVVDELVFGDAGYPSMRDDLAAAHEHADGIVRDRIETILVTLPAREYDVVDDAHLAGFNTAITDVAAACVAAGYDETAPTTIPEVG